MFLQELQKWEFLPDFLYVVLSAYNDLFNELCDIFSYLYRMWIWVYVESDGASICTIKWCGLLIDIKK